jgi:hypothetical protein
MKGIEDLDARMNSSITKRTGINAERYFQTKKKWMSLITTTLFKRIHRPRLQPVDTIVALDKMAERDDTSHSDDKDMVNGEEEKDEHITKRMHSFFSPFLPCFRVTAITGSCFGSISPSL